MVAGDDSLDGRGSRQLHHSRSECVIEFTGDPLGISAACSDCSGGPEVMLKHASVLP